MRGASSLSQGSSKPLCASCRSNTRALSSAVLASARSVGVACLASVFFTGGLFGLPFFFFFFPPAATCTITKSAATSRYSSISPMFRASPFDDYFLRGAFAPSPMEAMESRMAVSAMVFFIS